MTTPAEIVAIHLSNARAYHDQAGDGGDTAWLAAMHAVSAADQAEAAATVAELCDSPDAPECRRMADEAGRWARAAGEG